MNAILGWGDNGSVCVYAAGVGEETCSSGTGSTFYTKMGGCIESIPVIEDNITGKNTVHGVTYNCTYTPPPPPPPHGYRYMIGGSYGEYIGSWTTALTGMGQSKMMAVGDVSGDKKADVVSVEGEGAGETGPYRYMLGTSTGSGLAWNFTNLTGMTNPAAMALGDVNGDGKDDLVAVEPEGGGTYRYMLGISNGYNFAWNFTNLTHMNKPTHIAMGDINGDGKDDIIATEQYGSYFTYVKGISNGTTSFSWSGTNLTGMWTPYQLGLGDVNGDGKADIFAVEAVENSPSKGYSYMLGISNGSTFAWQSTNLSPYWKPYKFGVGDVNGDGLADIVALEAKENNPFTNTYEYRFGVRSGSNFLWKTAMGNLVPQEQVGVGDVTGDGQADVVSVEHY